MFFRRMLLAMVLLTGCKTGSSNTGVGAATTSAVAIGAAAVSRAAGGCIAICTAGTTCNPAKGLCEPLPCRGECGPNEHCEQTFSETKCVSGGPTSVEALVKGKTPAVPQLVPATAPPPDGSPTIVPAAQKALELPP
jgi:hypothetical protein